MEFKGKISLFKKEVLQENRYVKPDLSNLIPDNKVVYENALDFAKKIKLYPNQRIYAIISGDFIFGDFIEAFIDVQRFDVKELTIATLSLSENNIDSLYNLLHSWKFVEKLNLIISGYFYRHEIRKLVPYIYEKLDQDNKFQLAVCESHMKIAQFETKKGGKCVIQGSANLRSSQSIEQITLEENKELYDFNQLYFNAIIEKYLTIKKSIHYKNLFNLIKEVTQCQEVEVAAAQKPRPDQETTEQPETLLEVE